MKEVFFCLVVLGVASPLAALPAGAGSALSAKQPEPAGKGGTPAAQDTASTDATATAKDANDSAKDGDATNLNEELPPLPIKCPCVWSPEKCKFHFFVYRWASVVLPQSQMESFCDDLVLFMAIKCRGKTDVEVSEVVENGKTYFIIKREKDSNFQGFKCLKKGTFPKPGKLENKEGLDWQKDTEMKVKQKQS